MKTANVALNTENTSLKTANGALNTENTSLKTANGALNTENISLKTTNIELNTENISLKTANVVLNTENVALNAEISSLNNEISSLLTKFIPLNIKITSPNTEQTIQKLILGYLDNIIHLSDSNIVKTSVIEQLKETLRERDGEIDKNNIIIKQQKDEIATLLEVQNVVQIKPAAIRLGIFPIYSPVEDTPPVEISKFTLYLDDFGANKIGVIEIVREITGLGFKDATYLVDRTPVVVKDFLLRDDAYIAKKRIEDAGGRVSIRSTVITPTERELIYVIFVQKKWRKIIARKRFDRVVEEVLERYNIKK